MASCTRLTSPTMDLLIASRAEADGFTYCIEGGSSIYLSELAQILGLYETDLDKAFSVGNVSNVTFTNYDLVKIEKQADGDWLLTSLAPFTSEETLTIEMNDGVTFQEMSGRRVRSW